MKSDIMAKVSSTEQSLKNIRTLRNWSINQEDKLDYGTPCMNKNDRNSSIWQSGISKSLEEYVQRRVCFVNVQSSLHENVVFSVSARTCNAAYVIFIMWNIISG